MSTRLSTANAISLEKELIWFSSVLDTRIALYFEHDTSESEGEKSLAVLKRYLFQTYQMMIQPTDRSYLILIYLTSVFYWRYVSSHIRPDLLDLLFTRSKILIGGLHNLEVEAKVTVDLSLLVKQLHS